MRMAFNINVKNGLHKMNFWSFGFPAFEVLNKGKHPEK